MFLVLPIFSVVNTVVDLPTKRFRVTAIPLEKIEAPVVMEVESVAFVWIIGPVIVVVELTLRTLTVVVPTTDNALPMLQFLPIPIPPEKTTLPDMESVESVTLVHRNKPLMFTVFNVDIPDTFCDPRTVEFAPTKRFLPIPIPPLTTIAPEVTLLESVLLSRVKTPLKENPAFMVTAEVNVDVPITTRF